MENDNCITRNAFESFSNYKDIFAYKGNSTLERLNYSSDNPISSSEDFIDYLNLPIEYTFVERPAVYIGDKEVVRYDEFYNGIEVEPGGFAIIGGDPCNTLINAYVYSNFPSYIPPNILKDDLQSILNGQIIKSDLVFSLDHDDNCGLQQNWRVRFIDENQRQQLAWVNSNNGEIARLRSFSDGLGNFSSKVETVSPKNTSAISIGDEESVFLFYQFECDITAVENFESFDDLTPVCEFEDSNLQNLQSNFSSIENCFDMLSLDLPPVTHILITDCQGASPVSIPLEPFEEAALLQFPYWLFDQPNNANNFSQDIIVHELAHSILNQFFPSSTSQEHRLIHEFFADLFSLYVNTDGCGSENDWAMSFEDGSEIRDFDSFNPSDACNIDYTQITGTTPALYENGNPLRYLAFSLVNEGYFTLEGFFNLTNEILSTFPDDGTVRSLFDIYISNIDDQFGKCSDEADFTKRLAHTMCLGPEWPGCDLDIGITSTAFAYAGTQNICENIDNGRIRLTIPDEQYNSDASYIWSGLRPEWTVNGQTNNTAPTGQTITVEFPHYNWYPRQYNICVRSHFTEQEDCHKIVLLDCDDNDPTCEEIWALPRNYDHGGKEDFSLKTEKVVSTYIAFDLLGRFIIKGAFRDIQNELRRIPPQYLIVKSYTEDGQLISTEKVFNQLWQEN